MNDTRLDWHILTLEATPERARSIWQNEQLAFYKRLVVVEGAARRLLDRAYGVDVYTCIRDDDKAALREALGNGGGPTRE